MQAEGTGAIIQGVGVFVNAFGTLKQAGVNAGNLAARADVADQNAILEEENAAIQISLSRQQTRRIRSTQRSSTAKSGLRLEGSPLLVELEAARIGKFEVDQIQRASDIQAAGLRQRARALRKSAKNTRRAGLISAVGSIITGGGQIAASKGLI